MTLAGVLVVAFALNANAGQIGIGDFNGSETVTTFDGFGLPFSNPAPLVFDGNTYTTDTGTIRYFALQGCDAECLGTESGLGFMDVALGTPATRVGAEVGVLQVWEGFVEFFDAADNLLGTINHPPGSGFLFAAWEDSGGISRFRLTDLDRPTSIINLDNFRFEPIPEPSTALLLGGGLLGLAARGWRRKA
jgi:hypothetical protein